MDYHFIKMKEQTKVFEDSFNNLGLDKFHPREAGGRTR